MIKWEYKVVYCETNTGETETKLNALGNQGWELVSVSTDISSEEEIGFTSIEVAYLKRPRGKSEIEEDMKKDIEKLNKKLKS